MYFMQKKLLALAVAGALAPAAVMAQSSVQIYGRANLSFDNWRATGAAAGSAFDFKSRNRIVDSGSRVGFRVNEDLGGGMRAFVVIESGVNIDTGATTGQSGAANASTGTWATRDSYVGVGGGWGDVRMGRQSIWWANGAISQTGANYINTAVDGLINSRSGLAIPVARQSNTLSYNSPTVGGFNATLSYSPTSEAAVAGAETNGRVTGITGRYTTGALRAQVDYAQNRGATPIVPGPRTKNSALKMGIGWAYAPGAQISYIHARYKNENAISLFGAGREDRRGNNNLLNWEHMFGQWQLLAQYFWSPKLKGLNVDPGQTRTKGLTLATKYYLSKRTGVYASLSQVRNDTNAWTDLSGGGFSSAAPAGALTAANAGADPRVMAVGIMHNF
jgi:predicted porin